MNRTLREAIIRLIRAYSPGIAATAAAGNPAGADKDIQINVAGAFGADTGKFTYNSTTKTLTLTGTGSVGPAIIQGVSDAVSSGITIAGGDGTDTNGGPIYIGGGGGYGTGSLSGGQITIQAGEGDDAGGGLLLNAGSAAESGPGGNVQITVGTGADGGADGSIILTGQIRAVTSRTPASAAATGTPGEICWDSGFLYICVGANSWKRAAIAAW